MPDDLLRKDAAIPLPFPNILPCHFAVWLQQCHMRSPLSDRSPSQRCHYLQRAQWCNLTPGSIADSPVSTTSPKAFTESTWSQEAGGRARGLFPPELVIGDWQFQLKRPPDCSILFFAALTQRPMDPHKGNECQGSIRVLSTPLLPTEYWGALQRYPSAY